MTPREFQKLLDKPSVRFILDHTFFAQLFYSLDAFEDNAHGTLWVDGKRMGVNTEFFAGLRPELQIAALAHETLHCALHHPSRGQGRRDENMHKWQIACDQEVNTLLVENRFEIDTTWVQPNKKYAGLPAETIYDMMSDEEAGGDGGGGKGGRNIFDDLRDMGGSEGDKQEARDRMDARIVAAARSVEKQMGSLPAFARELLDKITNPKTPWQDVLRQFLSTMKFDDYSWDRPDRHGFCKTGCYMPRLFNEALGEIVIFYDTSGSISQEECNEFAGHVSKIMQDCHPSKIYAVPIDAEVHEHGVQELEYSSLPFALERIGGGGTDFVPAFEWVREKGINPECVIYLTDMYGSFPNEAPHYPTLWVSNSDVQEAPFGQVIDIRNK